MELHERIHSIKERIAAAAHRSGRSPQEIKLLAVTKTVPVDLVQAGLEAGLLDLGENYIQEAQTKIPLLGRSVTWHFIGRLQSNKAKYAVQLFDLIHSVDSFKLALELDKKAEAAGRRLGVLIQVNIAGEGSKGGVTPEAAPSVVDQVAGLGNLELRGLMTMPPFFDQPERVRPFFAALRDLRDKIGGPLKDLSMGMSGDFEVAIEEGATIVRIGTSLFGSRPVP
ncbi:MAG: YggS family pyridoxal phosphate-dependent enzyme [Deltaproteobacteria bacterium]|nr:YggS family pyridoxal phosphate-dependent enzyme [Deltaproteobacteria bacterium]